MKSHIVCLACKGKGWVRSVGVQGYPIPMRCGACHGTGTQRVAS